VARPTRSQRRARRQAQAEQQQQQSTAPRARTRQQVRATAPQEPRRETRERRTPGGGIAGFVSESWAELKKVEWPGQRQVMTGTVVVIIACGIVGGYLWLADLVLKRVVQNVLLGQ